LFRFAAAANRFFCFFFSSRGSVLTGHDTHGTHGTAFSFNWQQASPCFILTGNDPRPSQRSQCRSRQSIFLINDSHDTAVIDDDILW
jgi:hypothetical protein